jgi:HlyD family secretion protein
MLLGKVVAISPDVQTDATGLPYFLVRVALDAGAEDSALQRHSLLAGMPVEGFLIGERRTPLEYFWDPVKNSARRPVLPVTKGDQP